MQGREGGENAMRFARVNEVVLHHAVEGPPDAPTVVFSNSLGTDFRVWDPLLAHLGRDWERPWPRLS